MLEIQRREILLCGAAPIALCVDIAPAAIEVPVAPSLDADADALAHPGMGEDA
ncbi:MAG: hypothetical protein JO096_03970 [Alphaproteobacteria bacterium]|nr:hypothetical protein [Alphaproteobacteria bacterium]